MKMMSLEEIQSLFSDVHHLTPLTQAGQKMVFKGRFNDGDVVLKIMLNSDARERFDREMTVSTKYGFANVPRVLDYGERKCAGESILYVIEEYIDGETLRTRLARHNRLTLEETVELIDMLLSFAVQAEEKNIVHRDIKPENIMIDQHGHYWLLDFGIARHLDKSSLTVSQARFGPHTAGYAAPEQFRNLKKAIDPRTDLFSIGVVAYECISGTHPFREGAADALDVLYRTESVPVDLLDIEGDTHHQLAALINVLMEKFPSRRPKDAKTALGWFKSIRSALKLKED